MRKILILLTSLIKGVLLMVLVAMSLLTLLLMGGAILAFLVWGVGQVWALLVAVVLGGTLGARDQFRALVESRRQGPAYSRRLSRWVIRVVLLTLFGVIPFLMWRAYQGSISWVETKVGLLGLYGCRAEPMFVYRRTNGRLPEDPSEIVPHAQEEWWGFARAFWRSCLLG